MIPLFCSLASLAKHPKTESVCKTYSAEMEDMFGVPLRALRKTNGSVQGLFLTALRSHPAHILHLRRKVLAIGFCFLIYPKRKLVTI